jgi:DNA-binding response OmpR family regulator
MPHSAALSPDAHPTRVLLVDDDAHVRQMTRLMLSLDGFDVVEAGDAHSALDLFECETVDVVVTDLYMPDEDGHVLIARLRARDRRVPIVVVSGGSVHGRWSQPEVELGADAAVQKPFSAEDLVAAIRGVLDAP